MLGKCCTTELHPSPSTGFWPSFCWYQSTAFFTIKVLTRACVHGLLSQGPCHWGCLFLFIGVHSGCIKGEERQLVDDGSTCMGHLKTMLRLNSESEVGPAPSPINRAGKITCAEREEGEQEREWSNRSSAPEHPQHSWAHRLLCFPPSS
jgi:hypothetical protein